MSKTYDVAVVGATTLIGETVVELLEQRNFPVGKLHLLDWGDAVAKRVSFKDSKIVIQDIASFDFATAALTLFCADQDITAEFVPRAVEAGSVVIDHSTLFRDEPEIPLVIPEINSHAIAAYSQRGIIASPSAATIQMLLCLHPLHTAVGIEQISVTVCAAVSEYGRDAVEELASQTANLLNMRPIESKVFPRQIAFNVLPQMGGLEDSGYSKQEAAVVRESQKVLELPALKVTPTFLQVPVFFGHGLVLSVQTQEPLALEQVHRLLRQSPWLELVEEVSGAPTAVTEAAGTDAIYVGRIRADISEECGVTLWAVADNCRIGAALNSIQIAEILVKDYL